MTESVNTELQTELDKAQIILAYVLQEVGDVTISMGKPLTNGIAITVDENPEDNTVTVRLVTE